MRGFRSLLAIGWIFVVALVAPLLESGCSNDSTPSKAQIDANKQQQKLMHDQLQKGFAKRPAANRK